MSAPVPFGFPFVGSPQVAAATAAGETFTRRTAQNEQPSTTDRPWMKITNRYSGNSLFSWTMQAVAADGSFYDHPNGVAGTVAGLDGATQTVLPAEEMNGNAVSAFPVYVRGERAIGGGPTGGVLYRFAAPATGFTPSLAVDSTCNSLFFNAPANGTLKSLSFTATGYYQVVACAKVAVTLAAGGPLTTNEDAFGPGAFTVGSGAWLSTRAYYTPRVYFPNATGFSESCVTGIFYAHVTALSGGVATAPLVYSCTCATTNVTVETSVLQPCNALQIA